MHGMPLYMSPIVGTGCLDLGSQGDLISFNVSLPFNHTLWIQGGGSYNVNIHFTGPPLSSNNIVIRGFDTSHVTKFFADSYPTTTDPNLFSYSYNNLTGILDYMTPGGTFTFNIGTGFNDTSFELTTPGTMVIQPLAVAQERPSNCPTDPWGCLLYTSRCV